MGLRCGKKTGTKHLSNDHDCLEYNLLVNRVDSRSFLAPALIHLFPVSKQWENLASNLLMPLNNFSKNDAKIFKLSFLFHKKYIMKVWRKILQ